MLSTQTSADFDTVFHGTLLENLVPQGLDRSTLCWVKDWLDEQAQKEEVNGATSNCQTVTSGVLQGSVLGLSPVQYTY